jgi:spore maturation protein B
VLRAAVGTLSDWAIPVLLVGILVYGLFRKVKVYSVFAEGARAGFETAIRIIPPLVAIIVALGMLRASGALEAFAALAGRWTDQLGIPPSVVPMVLFRPLSGGAALGVVGDVIKSQGPDSYAGRLVSVMAGSTETTFYVLAVYMGAVGITRYRHALAAGLTADLVGFTVSVLVVRAFFG